jgi:hypothetical protein
MLAVWPFEQPLTEAAADTSVWSVGLVERPGVSDPVPVTDVHEKRTAAWAGATESSGATIAAESPRR